MNQSATKKTSKMVIVLNKIKTYFSKPQNIILLLFGIVLTFTTVAPIVAIVEDTFKIHPGTIDAHLTGKAGGYSVANYADLFTSKLARTNLWTPLLNTVLLAVFTCLISILFGGLFAFLITRTNLKCKKYLSSIFIFPYIMPQWTLAVVWQNVFNSNAVTGTSNGLLASLFGIAFPKWWCLGLFPSAVVLGLHYAPFAYILIRTSSTISEHAARRNEISLDELADAVDMTATASAEEHNMLSGIVKFANTEVQEIMRPRVDVVAVGIGDNYLSVKERIIASGFSRIPVYDEDLDNIKGILYVKDLLPYINNGDEFGWQQLLRKAYFVPEHKKINDLLEEFQSNKVHMAVVVDEYGSTLGIVSLEDILEEIVGEISDESDAVESAYTKLDDRNYLFDGKTHIGDFERILQLPENTFADVKGEAETLAGLMLEIKRDFLKKGDVVTTHDLRFTAHTIEGRRIDKVQVTLPE